MRSGKLQSQSSIRNIFKNKNDSHFIYLVRCDIMYKKNWCNFTEFSSTVFFSTVTKIRYAAAMRKSLESTANITYIYSLTFTLTYT